MSRDCYLYVECEGGREDLIAMWSCGCVTGSDLMTPWTLTIAASALVLQSCCIKMSEIGIN